jgi:hypothetical protein
MVSPSCSCCQPVRVVKHNVSMTCDDRHTFFIDFHEFTQCECKIQKCGAAYDTSGVEIVSTGGSQERSKRSFIEDLAETAMDKDTKERHRRNLLNDLAMLHASKKKR